MELVTIVQNGGPYALAAVMAFLYWAERTERQKIQASILELLERALNGLNAAAQASRDSTTAMQALNNTMQAAIFRLRDKQDD